MNIWRISVQNIKSRPLYTFLSILVLSLSIALLLGIQQLKTSFEYQMENNLGDIDLVIGAKGSPLQLILASVLHIDNPTGNISYNEALTIGNSPMIEKAVPISYGDNYKGYRIVGTTESFLSFYEAELDEGDFSNRAMEVILGHNVAQQLELNLGDTIISSHGLIDNTIEVHDDELIVVGILKPTQKVIDRLIITNLESIWDIHNHEDHDHDEIDPDQHEDDVHKDHDDDENHDVHDEYDADDDHNHDVHDERDTGDEHNHEAHDEHDTDDEHNHDEHDTDDDHNHDVHDEHHEDKEITSLLITFRNPMGLLTLPRTINENTNMQAALPKFELDRLYQFTGVGLQTISWIAYIILVISGLTIFLSLYKLIKERAFDLALMRTYGASNTQLIKMVIYEGLVIIGLAFVVGYILTKVGLHFIINYIENSPQQNMLQELPLNNILQIIGLVFAMIILAIAIAIYPIIKMNISTILSNEK
ncbi:ABC transporter permease [Psychroserpens sp.]|uniref:ABC transporter permease n=1 Tax=Psychroserpens sp. TaxID=2020870 RepID=UPI001B2E1D57|nr:FtsX-like permease family protein [Psychroserpens sp.]MBO6607638.1 ABC transporter permease [Psychroserpens sp.]MBO6631419.1 ABC transporter permease [Psychroserpens sp.]MBO6655050.1 ABC transporter permease [Psychroserpens sp.]MBO6683145.1 ABC transporter permease [Psychroserpens sp.]MBO6749676.1 ABC transporter permease [Psychroserpens sp.]